MPTLPIADLLLSRFAGSWTVPGDAFGNFAHWAAPVAVTAIWQGALISMGLALCLRIAPRVTAAHRFAAWAAGFAALVALPFAPAAAPIFTAPRGSATGIASASLPHTAHPWFALNYGFGVAIAVLWVLVALVRAGDLLVHAVRLRRLWNSAAHAVFPFGVESWPKKYELCTTRELDRPSVIGFFAPRILIPEWLYEKLTRQELEQVVLHEAEHLRRRDDWTNLLQKLCLVVFPLNPALAFVERRLCREREMACDEGVVRRTQAPRAYAACLAGLAERHIEHRAQALSLGARAKALALNAFDRRPELTHRVQSILARRNAIHPLAGRVLLGGLGCALAIGAVELARCPQLVAFVPAAPKIATQTAHASSPDLVTDRHLQPTVPGFRAINAMAILPQTVRQRIAGQQAAAHTACEHAGNTSILHSAVNAMQSAAQSVNNSSPRTVADNAKALTPVQQELVVFTTYEQVQGPSEGLGDRVISDYETDGAENPQPNQAGSGQLTITRLIFRIIPAGQRLTTAIPLVAVDSETMAKPATAARSSAQTATEATGKPVGQAVQRNASSQFSQPRAISLGNGWFVIQL